MSGAALRKKVCMIGVPAVGKTSLVRRYVHGVFSESYLSTIGVKVDKKTVQADGTLVELLVWDIHGDDGLARVQPVYVKGCHGCLLVTDGTSLPSLEAGLLLYERLFPEPEACPRILLINKADLEEAWEIDNARIQAAREQGWTCVETSAKTGSGVEEAFAELVGSMLA